jgi:aspartokinase/homoserine dehydrogenase 1
MRHRKGIAGRVFQTLGDNGINISAIAQGSSELNISMVVSHTDEAKALNVLHRAFFSDSRGQLSLFMIGTGLVGSALLKQTGQLLKNPQKKAGSTLRLKGICNIDGIYFDHNGFDPGEGLDRFSKHKKSYSVQALEAAIDKLAFSNALVVDCTSSAEIAGMYPAFLEKGISVVTPNKIANSGSKAFYNKLKALSAANRPAYLYETTVGAGLPVIKTIRSLQETGDRILKIEGILSGTMSFLFNTYDGSIPFAEVVRKARELGFTEPDPRSDLSGLDVVRKILILARETGGDMELEDIEKNDFLPESPDTVADLEEFFTRLSGQEQQMRDLYEKARSEDKVLRYIARYDGNRATVSLEMVDRTHPFYMLQGSDNIVSITTGRYLENPLVIRGPGAGAEVTAAGVLSDILQVETWYRNH